MRPRFALLSGLFALLALAMPAPAQAENVCSILMKKGSGELLVRSIQDSMAAVQLAIETDWPATASVLPDQLTEAQREQLKRWTTRTLEELNVRENFSSLTQVQNIKGWEGLLARSLLRISSVAAYVTARRMEWSRSARIESAQKFLLEVYQKGGMFLIQDLRRQDGRRFP